MRASDIRGTNYLPSTMAGLNSALGLVRKDLAQMGSPTEREGFFDPVHSRAELQAIAQAGFNNIRLWGSWWAWMVDPQGFRDVLSTIANQCSEFGLTITYIVWNGADASTFLGIEPARSVLLNLPIVRLLASTGRRNYYLLSAVWADAFSWSNNRRHEIPVGEPWMASQTSDPGNLLFRLDPNLRFAGWPADLLWLMGSYLDTVNIVFTGELGEKVLFSYDLFNEPDFLDGDYRVRREMFLDVMRFTYDRLGAGRTRCTVGFAAMSSYNKGFVADLYRSRDVKLDYLSSHAYRLFRDIGLFASAVRDAVQFAAGMGLDYVCSEFWERSLSYPVPPPVGPYLNILRGARCGGQMWGFLETNLFFTELPDPTRPDSKVQVWNSVWPPEARDGVLRPRRGTWVPGGNWPRSAIQMDVSSQSDLTAVQQWSAS